jgi:hypothetical protein
MRALTTQNIIRTGRRRLQFVDLSRLQTSVGKVVPPGEPAQASGAIQTDASGVRLRNRATNV